MTCLCRKEKRPWRRPEPEEIRTRFQVYFSAFCTLVKVPLRFVPTPCTTTMMATEMPAAMRPYSIAVAPESSRKKRFNIDMRLSPYCARRPHHDAMLLFKRQISTEREANRSVFPCRGEFDRHSQVPKRKGSGDAGAFGRTVTNAAYLSAFCTDVNVPLRLVPTFFTTVMMATEMPAAMRPYSM